MILTAVKEDWSANCRKN